MERDVGFRHFVEGMAYYYGLSGSGLNDRLARSHLYLASRAGDMCARGICLSEGWEMEKDYAKAAKCFEVKAKQGGSFAQYRMGLCYEHGFGVPACPKMAKMWYQCSAKQGNPMAQYNLAVCYDREGDHPELAVEWYRRAALQGNSYAALNLGMCYDGGSGVEKDAKKSFEWVHASAEMGDAHGQYVLGLFYARGSGVEPCLTKSAEWYQRAALQGHKDAQYNLGILYEFDLLPVAAYQGDDVSSSSEEEGKGIQEEEVQNEGTHQDLPPTEEGESKLDENLVAVTTGPSNSSDGQSREAKSRCSNQDSKSSRFQERNLALAAKWYRKSAEQGDSEAQWRLAVCYESGRGVESDLVAALRWYRKSAKQGHIDAMKGLITLYSLSEDPRIERDPKQACLWSQALARTKAAAMKAGL